MTEISVIVPFYNSERYLERSLTSLRDQVGPSMEFICIDDGSTDGSALICRSFAESDDRFRYVRIDHSGVSAARNEGLRTSSGRYVCFLDSDDELRRGSLCYLYKAAIENDCDTVKFNAKIIHGPKWMKDCFSRHNELIDGFDEDDIFKNRDTRPFVWAHFIRKTSIEGIQFNESLTMGEDQEFIIRYMKKVNRVLFTGKVAYNHYVYDDSSYGRVSTDWDKKCEQHIMMVESVLPVINSDCKEYAEWVFDILYEPYSKSSKNREIRDSILSIFETASIGDRIDDRKRKKWFSELIRTS